MTLTIGSAAKVFDGTELTNETCKVTSGSFVEGETYGMDFGESGQTAVGKSANNATVVFAGEGNVYTAQAGNYNVTVVPGTLAVYKQSIDPDGPDVPDPDDPDDPDYPDPDDPTIPDDPDDPDYPAYYNGVTVNSPFDLTYDGSEHKWAPEVKDKDGNPLTEGTDYKVEYFDANGNVKTDFTNVTGTIKVVITGQGNYSGTVERSYQITPIDLVVTIDNLTKVEGEADPQFGFDSEGVLEGESMAWTGQFARQAGETAGTYTVSGGTFALTNSADGSFLAANYNLIVVPGSLTITAAPVPVTPPTPGPTPDDDGDDDGTVPVPTPTPAEEAIAEGEIPLAASAGGVEIVDDATPMTSGDHPDCWVHWFMILGIVVTVAYTAGVVGRRSKFSGDLKDYEDKVLGNNQNNQ